MNEKKVVLIIVEGTTDEIALGGLLKDFFSSENVQFEVVHGDVTSDYISSDNPKSRNYIIHRIKDLVELNKNKYGYKWTDYIKIIHIVDMDGAFVDSGYVKKAEKLSYTENCIFTDNVQEILSRNRHKSKMLEILYMNSKIKNIYYRIYYNSCNLEHVLYGELKEFTDEQKEEMADEFADNYDGQLEKFQSFISQSNIRAPGDYRRTWLYIEKGANSLCRHSNMHLIFQEKKI